MTFVESITTCLKKYATFTGTAVRSEYWWFVLFQVLLLAVLSMISNVLYGVAAIGLLVPAVAVAARRLHDTDRSGWMQLIALIPVVGSIILIVFLAQEGKPNRY